MQTIRIPATTANLGPGFDCMGMALGLCNEVDFEFLEDGLIIEVPSEDRAAIPADARNLIYRVFSQVLTSCSHPVPGLHLRQRNPIPNMRGLGSSAACVAAGVLLANLAMGRPYPDSWMLNTAAQLEGHPDNVLPAFLGGLTVGALENETVHYQRIVPPEGLRCAVIIPSFTLSTRKARDVLPKQVPMKDAVHNLSYAALLAAGLACGDIDVLRYALKDRLHQNYRKALIPDFDEVVSICEQGGALGACLSGAGPTIIAYLDGGKGFVDAVQPELDALNGNWKAQILEVHLQGIELL